MPTQSSIAFQNKPRKREARPRTGSTLSQFLLYGLSVLATAALAYGTLLPGNFQRPSPKELSLELHRLLSPFTADIAPGDFWLNVGLYLPLGCVWALAAVSSVTSLPRKLLRVVLISGYSLFLSVCLESLQILLPTRIASGFDVAANWLGANLGILGGVALLSLGAPLIGKFQAMIGALLLNRPWLQTSITWILLPARHPATLGALSLLALSYALLLRKLISSNATPTFDPVILAERLKLFWAVPFKTLQRSSYGGAFQAIALDIAAFVPLGLLVALIVLNYPSTSLIRRRRLVVAAGCLLFLGLLFESTQLFLPDRVPDITDVLLYFTGSLIGLYLCTTLQTTTRRFRRTAAVARRQVGIDLRHDLGKRQAQLKAPTAIPQKYKLVSTN